eukprot:GDKI01049536.1.p1 GENE.GDKI01049536.1~~GDKI01049536.1.p1  ORF type:complete len:248 (+),score=67.91 GDKI01049536.1:98-841(+)
MRTCCLFAAGAFIGSLTAVFAYDDNSIATEPIKMTASILPLPSSFGSTASLAPPPDVTNGDLVVPAENRVLQDATEATTVELTDPCKISVCQNDALCAAVPRTAGTNDATVVAYDYICNCKPGFTGTYCETKKWACSGNPCVNGGVCLDDVMDNTKYTCVCDSTHSGDKCQYTRTPGVGGMGIQLSTGEIILWWVFFFCLLMCEAYCCFNVASGWLARYNEQQQQVKKRRTSVGGEDRGEVSVTTGV